MFKVGDRLKILHTGDQRLPMIGNIDVTGRHCTVTLISSGTEYRYTVQVEGFNSATGKAGFTNGLIITDHINEQVPEIILENRKFKLTIPMD